MEALTRLVTESLARHGLDRPVDPRRLQWSRWFRCDSPHSLLVVPSKPGIFALAEEIMDVTVGKAHVGTAAPGCPTERSSVATMNSSLSGDFLTAPALQRCKSRPQEDTASAAEGRRMLAVLQFCEDDNMAFVLDCMFTHANPMRSRLNSGNCFVRFVVVEDQEQRRSICAALNQWMRNSAEKASGFPADFSSSLELARSDAPDHVGRTLLSANLSAGSSHVSTSNSSPSVAAATMDSGAGKNLHCPPPFPSGF